MNCWHKNWSWLDLVESPSNFSCWILLLIQLTLDKLLTTTGFPFYFGKLFRLISRPRFRNPSPNTHKPNIPYLRDQTFRRSLSFETDKNWNNRRFLHKLIKKTKKKTPIKNDSFKRNRRTRQWTILRVLGFSVFLDMITDFQFIAKFLSSDLVKKTHEKIFSWLIIWFLFDAIFTSP